VLPSSTDLSCVEHAIKETKESLKLLDFDVSNVIFYPPPNSVGGGRPSPFTLTIRSLLDSFVNLNVSLDHSFYIVEELLDMEYVLSILNGEEGDEDSGINETIKKLRRDCLKKIRKEESEISYSDDLKENEIISSSLVNESSTDSPKEVTDYYVNKLYKFGDEFFSARKKSDINKPPKPSAEGRSGGIEVGAEDLITEGEESQQHASSSATKHPVAVAVEDVNQEEEKNMEISYDDYVPSKVTFSSSLNCLSVQTSAKYFSSIENKDVVGDVVDTTTLPSSSPLQLSSPRLSRYQISSRKLFHPHFLSPSLPSSSSSSSLQTLDNSPLSIAASLSSKYVKTTQENVNPKIYESFQMLSNPMLLISPSTSFPDPSHSNVSKNYTSPTFTSSSSENISNPSSSSSSSLPHSNLLPCNVTPVTTMAFPTPFSRHTYAEGMHYKYKNCISYYYYYYFYHCNSSFMFLFVDVLGKRDLGDLHVPAIIKVAETTEERRKRRRKERENARRIRKSSSKQTTSKKPEEKDVEKDDDDEDDDDGEKSEEKKNYKPFDAEAFIKRMEKKKKKN
jgi:hypothetical protein